MVKACALQEIRDSIRRAVHIETIAVVGQWQSEDKVGYADRVFQGP